MVVDRIAWFQHGTFSKSARNTKTSWAGLRMVTVFSNCMFVPLRLVDLQRLAIPISIAGCG